eukprot:1179711-Prorocentrum_minimum.AAC.2
MYTGATRTSHTDLAPGNPGRLWYSLLSRLGSEARGRLPLTVRSPPDPLSTPHPRPSQVTNWTLTKALEDCYCLVTINSNAAVLAALAGVPVLATDPGEDLEGV